MNELQRAFYWVAAATVVLYLAVIGLAVYFRHDADQTRQSLCALRHDLERRIAATQKYLDETPHAIPGITPAQLRESIRNQQQTVQALSRLACTP